MTYFKKSVFLLAFLTIFVTLASCSNATSKKSANLQSTVEKTDKKNIILIMIIKRVGSSKVATVNHQLILTRKMSKI